MYLFCMGVGIAVLIVVLIIVGVINFHKSKPPTKGRTETHSEFIERRKRRSRGLWCIILAFIIAVLAGFGPIIWKALLL